MRPVTSGGSGGLTEPVSFTQPVVVDTVDNAESAPTLTVQGNDGSVQPAVMEWKNGAGVVKFRMMNIDYWGDVGFESIGENILFTTSSAPEASDGGLLTIAGAGVTLYAPPGANQAILDLSTNGVSVQGKTTIDVPIHTESGPTLTVQGNNGSVQPYVQTWRSDAGVVFGSIGNVSYWGDVRFEGIGMLALQATDISGENNGGQLYLNSGLDRSAILNNGRDGGSFASLRLQNDGSVELHGAKHGFFGVAPVVKPTAVPVTAQGIHDALVSLGLIAA